MIVRVTQDFFTVLCHAVLILGVLTWLFFVFRLIFAPPKDVEKMIRAIALVSGIMIVLVARPLGVSIADLLTKTLEANSPNILTTLGVAIPAGLGTVLAWYFMRTIHGGTNVQYRLLVLISSLTVTEYFDVYATAVAKSGFEPSRLLLPNMTFVLAMAMYVILRHDPGPITKAKADGNKGDVHPARESDPRELVIQGNSFLLEGRYGRALLELNKALEMKPHNVAALTVRAEVYFQMGKYKEAYSDVNHLIKVSPQNALAYLMRSRIYGKDSFVPEWQFEQDLDKTIELDPTIADAFVWRGNLRFSRAMYEKALSDYSRALELAPGDAAVHASRGRAYLHLGCYEEANEDFEQTQDLTGPYVVTKTEWNDVRRHLTRPSAGDASTE